MELLNKRENVAMVFSQQLLEFFTTLCLYVLLCHCSTVHESLVDLVVEFVPIGDNHEGPPGSFARLSGQKRPLNRFCHSLA